MSLLPSERKAELVRRGGSMTQIAHDLGVSISHVSQVIAGKRRSPRVEQAVAVAIGREADEVFAAAEEPQPANT